MNAALYRLLWIAPFVLLLPNCAPELRQPSSDPACVEQQPSAQQQGDDKNSLAVLERFKVHRHGDALIVPVTFKGKEYQFIVDTGASMSCYDTSLPLGPAKQRAIIEESAAGPVSVSLFAAQKSMVGKLPVVPGEFSVGIDLSKMREVTGYPIHGIIGMDFLANYVVQIDFDEGELLFSKKAEPQSGTPFRLEFSRQCPMVKATVHDQSGIPFLLDTGSDGCGLEKELVARLEKKGELRFMGQTLQLTPKGTSSSRVVRGKKMSLGEFDLADPVVEEGRHNLIGLDFLSRFKVTFDFPGSTMYLQEGKRCHEPDLWDVSGLHILRKQGKTVVHSVNKGSPAATAGIRARDEIVTVGNGKAEQMSLFEIRRLCCQQGAALNLTIERYPAWHLFPLPGTSKSRIVQVRVDLKDGPAVINGTVSLP